jgi:demethylmenaquinone methyltransferase/2-methoxy-6-polyprenyl-1,4-benzoquinol methylase
VPPEKFAGFWETVGAALAPGGRVFFIDSRPTAKSTASNHVIDPESNFSLRRLNDGREFTIYKLFYDPTQLGQQLAQLGWQIEVGQTPNYFLYGNGSKH